MVTIRLIDDSCERYTQKRDCTCLGRRWDNIAEKVKVIKPQGEENNVCAMIMLHDNKIIDHIIVGEEPIDITSNASQYSSIQIGFSFSNETGYIKNSEVVDYYFAEAIKPTDFVPMPPTQEENINNLIGKSFVRSELIENILNFYNIVGDVISSVDLSGFAGGGGSGGGIVNETDPTVPDFVKNISEEDINNWNNKSNFSGSYNDLTDKPTNNATTDYVDEKVDDVREVAEGKTKSFTIANLTDLGTLLGIDTSVVADEYTITTTTITYKDKSIVLKQGDLFLIVDINVPDYWVSVDDMKIYKMETTKVDLTDYVKNTDYASSSKAGIVKFWESGGIGINNANGNIYLSPATKQIIDDRALARSPITVENFEYAVKVGLIANRETLTDEEKTKAQSWLGVPQFKATEVGENEYSLSITTEV